MALVAHRKFILCQWHLKQGFRQHHRHPCRQASTTRQGKEGLGCSPWAVGTEKRETGEEFYSAVEDSITRTLIWASQPRERTKLCVPLEIISAHSGFRFY